jgi:hypothetical protein
MNRIYAISTDGRLFTAHSKSSSFEPIDLNDDDSTVHHHGNLMLRRISSSEWCIWCISIKFELFVYVLQSDTPIEHEEAFYEFQRRYNPLLQDSFTDKLLPTDGHKSSSLDGLVYMDEGTVHLPSSHWSWKTEWFHEQNSSDVHSNIILKCKRDDPNNLKMLLGLGVCLQFSEQVLSEIFRERICETQEMVSYSNVQLVSKVYSSKVNLLN